MKIKKFNRILLLLVLAFITSTDTLLAGELYDKVVQNDIEAVKKLLAAGADINEQVEVGGAGTMTPLLAAVFYRYEEMAKLLISEGADINAKTSRGETPLIGACHSSEELARLLVSKGAEINSDLGTGAFTHCISGIMNDAVSISLAELLLSKGANVDETDTSGPVAGYTCLIIVAGNKKPELAKFLIKNGANVNAKAKDGTTPLSMAIRENDTAMVKLLKDFGAKE
jgi:ankyrin repeat protein